MTSGNKKKKTFPLDELSSWEKSSLVDDNHWVRVAMKRCWNKNEKENRSENDVYDKWEVYKIESGYKCH